MIITSIKRSKKGNVLVYADNEYLISLSPEVFVKTGLKPGSYIDGDIIKEITADSDAYKAKEKALRLLSFRSHSKKELEMKIKRSFDEHSAQKAAQKMAELGLIDDAAFAKSYANELLLRKFYSLKRIEYELMKKGIEKSIISEISSELDIDEEANMINFLKSKYSGKLEDEKCRRRAVAALQRLGYSLSLILRVINEFR